MDNSLTVADLESDLENAFTQLRDLDRRGQLPMELRPLLLLAPMEGSSVHVSLRHRDQARQIHRNYGSQAFTQRGCAAWIVFEAPQIDGAIGGARRSEPRVSPFDEFIRALDRAESEPQLHFVSLKWFRDTYLAKLGFGWAQDPETPRRILQEATEREMVLTAKVANPKAPEFPVTSIHLNRKHPEVQRLVGDRNSDPRGDPDGNETGGHDRG